MRDTIRTVLVPVDFSASSEGVIAYATRLARRLDASLELLHVVEDPYLTGIWSPDIYVPDVIRSLETLATEAGGRLDLAVAAIRAQGVTATSVVKLGSAARTIVEHATAEGVDLIVIGTHGRTGLAHVLMGSVAERIVRFAPCPVLTVRATPVKSPVTQPVGAVATIVAA